MRRVIVPSWPADFFRIAEPRRASHRSMCCEQQRWLREMIPGQRPRIRCRTVLRLQFAQYTKIQGAQWTGGHAGRRQTGFEVIRAKVTLGHAPARGVVLRRVVRARPAAILATHALVLIDDDDAIGAFVHGPRWAYLDADRTLAVIARD